MGHVTTMLHEVKLVSSLKSHLPESLLMLSNLAASIGSCVLFLLQKRQLALRAITAW